MNDPTPAEREAAKRAAYVAGLRALATILEQRPELALPFDGHTSGLTVFVDRGSDQRDQLAAWARALPGKKTKQQAGTAGDMFRVSGTLHGLKVDVIADRDEVCERVVTGTREVTETVPDPQALAAVPTVEVRKVVEDVEWVCRPVLGETATVFPAAAPRPQPTHVDVDVATLPRLVEPAPLTDPALEETAGGAR